MSPSIGRRSSLYVTLEFCAEFPQNVFRKAQKWNPTRPDQGSLYFTYLWSSLLLVTDSHSIAYVGNQEPECRLAWLSLSKHIEVGTANGIQTRVLPDESRVS